MKVYTLSFSHTVYRGSKAARAWKVVPVDISQVKNVTYWLTPPEIGEGQPIQVVIAEFPMGVELVKDGTVYVEKT